MKPFTLKWWIEQLVWVTTLRTVAIRSHNFEMGDKWTKVGHFIEQRIITKYGENETTKK